MAFGTIGSASVAFFGKDATAGSTICFTFTHDYADYVTIGDVGRFL